jgi:DNA-binding CsgD family transcriptional regulator
MWEDRAHHVRREVAALAGAGLGTSGLHAAALDLVDRAVGSDLACWAAVDPETLVISTMTSGRATIPTEFEPRLAEAEYATPGEPHRFATLARRGDVVARLSQLSAEERGASARVREVWRPLGISQEVRVVFAVDGVCWGVAGLVRTGPDFSDREVDFLVAVAPAVAAATRVSVRREVQADDRSGRPAIVVVGPHGQLRSLTPAARDWQDRLEEVAPGRFELMMQVMAGGARTASGHARARVRDAHGRWAVLDADRLVGAEEDQVAVAIEPVTGDQVVGLLLAAYGLTARERDVCAEVLAGRPTADIAGRLAISVHTVQDHLKSVFTKVDVRSRGELVARLHADAT